MKRLASKKNHQGFGSNNEQRREVNRSLIKQFSQKCTKKKIQQQSSLPSRHDGSVSKSRNKVSGKAVVTEEGASQIQSLVDEIFENSEIFSRENAEISTLLPRFFHDELENGDFLGQGEFGVVHEICRIKLRPSSSLTNGSTGQRTTTTEADENDAVTESFVRKSQDRNFMSKNFFRQGTNARYAIKTINTTPPRPRSPGEEGVDQITHTLQAVVDLANEAIFLSELNHCNVIKIRGMSPQICDDSSFIVLDRIYDTLNERIKIWKTKNSKLKKVISKIKFKGKQMKCRDFLVARMMVCYGICEALVFLHHHKILHRDLKPENIGFDVRDDVKIFDFGLAREMKVKDRNVEKNDGTYLLSGMTGSLPYMAPEVLSNAPYNDRADMFSLGFLMWQIVSIKVPYAGQSEGQVVESVYRKQERPELGSNWSPTLVSLVSNCWSPNASKRPSSVQAGETIRMEVFISGQGDDMDETLDRTGRSEAMRGMIESESVSMTHDEK